MTESIESENPKTELQKTNSQTEYFGMTVDSRFSRMIEYADLNMLDSLIKDGFSFKSIHTLAIDEKIWDLKNSIDKKDLSSTWEDIEKLGKIRDRITDIITNKNDAMYNNDSNRFKYLGVDIYPSGSVEILCLDKHEEKVKAFLKDVDASLNNFKGVSTSIEWNRGPEGKVNGQKLVLQNSIKENNKPFQKHVIEILDKYSINYSDTSLANLKKNLESQKATIPSAASIRGENTNNQDLKL